MKYLVTGAAGFIGSNFVHHLYRRHKDIQVTVLDKMSYAGHPANIDAMRQYPGFTFIQGDICDPAAVKKAMAGANVVVNFAAESSVDRSIDNAEAFLRTDITGVAVLLQEARRQKNLKRFIQISTDEVYGQALKGSFRETDELKPRNPYAAAKLGGERLAYSFFATYGIPVIITRASNNYGPASSVEKMIPLFTTNLLEGKAVPVYGKGKQVRDWLYVEDHCAAIDLLIGKGKNGEVYNIGGGQELTNIDLTLRLLQIMGKDKSAITYVKDRPGHDLRYSLDCAKINKLGWKPKQHIDDGLALTVAWYKDNGTWWREARERMDRRYIKGFWGG